jgi:hypothetical protein
MVRQEEQKIDLKTTQMYVGRISETEALRWMDRLHGK